MVVATNRVAGTVYVKIDGKQVRVRGKWTLNPGEPKREAVVGGDGVHGYTEKPQACYLEGEITPTAELNIRELQNVREASVTVEWGAGKGHVLRGAWFAGDGTIDLEEGSMTVRFEAMSCEPI